MHVLICVLNEDKEPFYIEFVRRGVTEDESKAMISVYNIIIWIPQIFDREFFNTGHSNDWNYDEFKKSEFELHGRLVWPALTKTMVCLRFHTQIRKPAKCSNKYYRYVFNDGLFKQYILLLYNFIALIIIIFLNWNKTEIFIIIYYILFR